VPAKADIEQQKAFIEKYTELKSTVGADEPILFGDSVHPYSGNEADVGRDKERHG